MGAPKYATGQTPGMVGGGAQAGLDTAPKTSLIGGALPAVAAAVGTAPAPTMGSDILTPNSPGLGGNQGAAGGGPMTTGTGFTGKQPTLGMSPTQMTDNPVDIHSAGVGEKAFDDVGKSLLDPTGLSKFLAGGAGGLGAPGAGEQYWNQVQGSINAPGSTQQVFNELHGQMPQIAQTPGLDPYYNNAAKNLSEDINRQYASRGMFGSTPALQGIGRGLTDLRADQAKNEADYNLKRLAEQRAWTGQLDTAAQNADQSGLGKLLAGGQISQGAEALQHQGSNILGNLLTQGGQLDIQKLQAYLTGGLGAETAKNNRVGTLFGDTLTGGDRTSGIIGGNFGAESGAMGGLTDAIAGGGIAKATDSANFAQALTEAFKGDTSMLMNLLQGGKSLMGGGAPTATNAPGNGLASEPFMSPSTSASGK
jgi:hypothetical protein